MKKSAYLYFYSDTPQIPELLILSVCSAAIVFEKVYLSVSNTQYQLIMQGSLFPDNVILDIVNSNFATQKILTELQGYYQNSIIKSNSPHIELHCINRWLHLKNQNMFGNDQIFSIDWDTIIFKGIRHYFNDLEGIDLAATNLDVYNLKHEPIWALCPNMLVLSQRALDYYVDYLYKYIRYSRNGKSIIRGNFCDMHPWSSVISLSLSDKTNLKLLNFNDYVHTHPVVDHNFRVLNDCGLSFKGHKYYFPSNVEKYISTDYLLAKELIFSPNSIPYFALDSYISSSRLANSVDKSWLKEAACVHFSGVEAKYLLFYVFKNDILNSIKTESGAIQ